METSTGYGPRIQWQNLMFDEDERKYESCKTKIFDIKRIEGNSFIHSFIHPFLTFILCRWFPSTKLITCSSHNETSRHPIMHKLFSDYVSVKTFKDSTAHILKRKMIVSRKNQQ